MRQSLLAASESFKLISGARRGTHGSFGVPASDEDSSVNVLFLDNYAETKWEVSIALHERR